jgi:hypothetical protein
MSPERPYRNGAEPDGAPALLGLRLTEDVGFVRAAKSAPHSEHAAFKVHIVPLEGQELDLAHAGVDGEYIEGRPTAGWSLPDNALLAGSAGASYA